MKRLELELQQDLGDRYRIAGEVGRGGSATIYRATDLKHDRVVALKVLHRELAAAIGADRFAREIRLLAKLHHPHVLALYDSGQAARTLFYVMPFVEGETLGQRLARVGTLRVEDVLHIGGQVADALSHAHAHNVVHRDIKPENILLGEGNAFVADFGVARRIERGGSDRMTAAGMTVGTPAYMSPEQASGEMSIDGRSDVYSLGCVMYEMLAGSPPFGGKSPRAVIAQRFTRPPPRVRSVRPEVSPALESAICKALAPSPADRFDSAGDLALALEAAVAAPVTPTDTPVVEEAGGWRRALRRLWQVEPPAQPRA